jgi:hypothetical protein
MPSSPCPLHNSRWLSHVETSVAGASGMKKTAAGGFDGAQPPGREARHSNIGNTLLSILHARCSLHNSRWLSSVETSVAGALGMKKTAAGGFDGAQPPGGEARHSNIGNTLLSILHALCSLHNSRWLSHVETSVAEASGMKKTAAGGFDGAQPPGGESRLRDARPHALCPLHRAPSPRICTKESLLREFPGRRCRIIFAPYQLCATSYLFCCSSAVLPPRRHTLPTL